MKHKKRCFITFLFMLFALISAFFSILDQCLITPKICLHQAASQPPKHPKPIIAIDAGHGGYDPGKVSKNGTQEKDLNLQIAIKLKDILDHKGYNALLTRHEDCSLTDPASTHPKQSDLRNRVQFFNDNHAILAISIHQNSFPNPSVHGTQMFYSTKHPQNRAFVNSLERSLSQTRDITLRTSTCTDNYYILNHETCPTVLIECGFLSCPEEEMLLANPKFQDRLCIALAQGIEHFLSSNTTQTQSIFHCISPHN